MRYSTIIGIGALIGSGNDDFLHIPDSDGNPSVFKLEHDDNGVWLNRNWYNDGNKLDLDNQWVVRIRNSLFSPLFTWRSFVF